MSIMVSMVILTMKKRRIGVSCSVGPKEGLRPSSFNLDFCSVLVKNYLGRLYPI